MVIMEQEGASIRSLPLSFLPKLTKDKLSNLLNSVKVLPADGPRKLHRDWRGLADLANIPSEVQSSIRNCPDQTARVLELWLQDPSVNIGNLLENLELMDRYDVYDDILSDLAEQMRKDNRIVNLQNQPTPLITVDDEIEILTYDDRLGYNHQYDAFVLYAEKDQEFVDELIAYLASEGFQICTKDKLLPGQTTYPRVAKLISERCLRIILVYSPEFLVSPADTFFRDYAQAITIDSQSNRIIPIMYRDCHLPAHLALYHNLRYDSGMYNFWEKLTHTINITKMQRILPACNPVSPRIQMSHSSSAVNIVEVPTSNQSYLIVDEDRLTQRSVSEETFGDVSSPEESISSDNGEVRGGTKKKKSPKARTITFFKNLTRKNKNKNVLEEVNGS